MSSPVLAHGQTFVPELNDLVRNQTSALGRLVAICTFRDFRLMGSANESGSQAIEWATRRLHQEILNSWLSLSLLEQKCDVAGYLMQINEDPASLVSLVARAEELMPEGSIRAQQDQFAHSLATVYALLTQEWNREPANRVWPIAAKNREESVVPPATNVIAA
jgi:hypothetical protein